EEPEHRADAGAGPRDPVGFGPGREALTQPGGHGLERGVGLVALDDLQGREAGGDRQRVSAQGAGLIDGPERGDALHDLASAPVGADRHAAADDLAEASEIRGHAEALLGAAWGHAKAGHDLVEDQHGALALGDLAERLEVAGP